MRRMRVIATLTLLAELAGAARFLPVAYAEESAPQPAKKPRKKRATYTDEEEQIPRQTTAPPSLVKGPPSDIFTCERQFLWNGKKLTCDSDVQRDAENLRPILHDTPSAVSELDTYQQNRRNVRYAAYFGTLGVVMVIVGTLVSRRYTDDAGNLTDLGNAIRNVSSIGGFSIAGGSLVYGLSMIKTNEAHLGNAVQSYNQAHPTTPIELEFSTGITF